MSAEQSSSIKSARIATTTSLQAPLSFAAFLKSGDGLTERFFFTLDPNEDGETVDFFFQQAINASVSMNRRVGDAHEMGSDSRFMLTV